MVVLKASDFPVRVSHRFRLGPPGPLMARSDTTIVRPFKAETPVTEAEGDFATPCPARCIRVCWAMGDAAAAGAIFFPTRSSSSRLLVPWDRFGTGANPALSRYGNAARTQRRPSAAYPYRPAARRTLAANRRLARGSTLSSAGARTAPADRGTSNLLLAAALWHSVKLLVRSATTGDAYQLSASSPYPATSAHSPLARYSDARQSPVPASMLPGGSASVLRVARLRRRASLDASRLRSPSPKCGGLWAPGSSCRDDPSQLAFEAVPLLVSMCDGGAAPFERRWRANRTRHVPFRAAAVRSFLLRTGRRDVVRCARLTYAHFMLRGFDRRTGHRTSRAAIPARQLPSCRALPAGYAQAVATQAPHSCSACVPARLWSAGAARSSAFARPTDVRTIRALDV